MSAWTRPAMEKLIRLYREHPCLYNSHMSEYRNQTMKKRTWEFIKNNLQDVRSGVTAEQVKNKINSMRSQLSAEYAKLRYNQNYEPKIWFFNQLEFLKEFTRNASAERNTPTPNRMNESFDESSRDSTPSRNSISSPASFYDRHSGIRDSPLLGRMRTGISSPAPSLYGEEAEPFLGEAARRLPESKSFEVSSIADEIPTSTYATATDVNSSIFDQVTAGSIHVSSVSSPDISPINNRGNQPANADPSIFRVPHSSTPMIRPQENAAMANSDVGDSSRIFSPPRQLVFNEDDVKNTYEIIVLSDTETPIAGAQPNIKRELVYEMYTQTDDPEPVRISSSEISVQTEDIPELAIKNVTETAVQTDADLSNNEKPQLIRNSVCEIFTQTEDLLQERELEEPKPDARKVEVREMFVQTEDENADEPQAGPSNMETRKINKTPALGTFLSHKRKFSTDKKIPTEESDSEEYFSAEEYTPPTSPAPKKAKIIQVTAEMKLPNFFMPIREMDEADAFGQLVALKLRPLAAEDASEIEKEILSIFTPKKKKLLNFWPF